MSFLTDLSRASDILAHQLRFNLLLSNDDAAILFSERLDFAVAFYATSTTPPSGPRPPSPHAEAVAAARLAAEIPKAATLESPRAPFERTSYLTPAGLLMQRPVLRASTGKRSGKKTGPFFQCSFFFTFEVNVWS